MRARSGSFIVPADAVSGLGQGNTYAGAKMWGQMLSHSVGPAGVARAIERAATARRPRARYVAPRFAGLFVTLMRLLPTRWADQAARSMLGLSRRRVTALLPAAQST